MAVKTFKKSTPVMVSVNFSSYEFRCGIGRTCSCQDTLIDEQLWIWLEDIRKHFGGKKINITSAYRCPSYNTSIGSSTGSYHVKGRAVDFVVQGVAPRAVATYAEKIGVKGIGLYETAADGHFVHIDTRTAKAFWYGQGQAARTTFQNLNQATTTTGGTTTGSNTTVTNSATLLKWGSSGEAVKHLQEKLIKLGYDLGSRGADGDFGAKTDVAVRKFQEENGLDNDGIAGPLTLEAINKKCTASFVAGDKIVVTASLLNIRTGAGTGNPSIGTTKKGSKYSLAEVKDGWGRLKEHTGWVSLEYCQKQ